jgi:hypothetical protein
MTSPSCGCRIDLRKTTFHPKPQQNVIQDRTGAKNLPFGIESQRKPAATSIREKADTQPRQGCPRKVKNVAISMGACTYIPSFSLDSELRRQHQKFAVTTDLFYF